MIANTIRDGTCSPEPFTADDFHPLKRGDGGGEIDAVAVLEQIGF